MQLPQHALICIKLSGMAVQAISTPVHIISTARAGRCTPVQLVQHAPNFAKLPGMAVQATSTAVQLVCTPLLVLCTSKLCFYTLIT